MPPEDFLTFSSVSSRPSSILCYSLAFSRAALDENGEEEDGGDVPANKRSRSDIITFTEEQAAELARNEPSEDASVSEKVLVQSAAERDRVSEMKDKSVELESEPKFANRCNFCPKSFRKPSDLVR